MKSIHTFAAFCEANNICNAEGQTYSNNKEIISLKPDEGKYSKDEPQNRLHTKEIRLNEHRTLSLEPEKLNSMNKLWDALPILA